MSQSKSGTSLNFSRAFAVKVAAKRLPVFPFSGLLKGCKGRKTHRFESDGTNQIWKTGSRLAATFTATFTNPFLFGGESIKPAGQE